MSATSPETVRIRLVQMEVLPGRPQANTARILRAIEAARADSVEIVAFPEMAVPGYLIGDEWERGSFLRECESCGKEICGASRGIIASFGNVGIDWTRRNEDGRVRKYNSLFVAENGHFVGPSAGPYDFVVKTLLPNYREFDDSRHFFDLRGLAAEEDRELAELLSPVVTGSGLSLGCVLCEDAWDIDYAGAPLDMLAANGADLFLNASASPFTLSKNHKRNRIFSAHAARLQRPFLYVNNVGIQNNGKTIFTFDGASCVYDGHGNQTVLESMFVDGHITFELPLSGEPFGPPIEPREDGVAELTEALLYGTRKFMAQCGVSKVVVGASGGIDSSVVAALYSRIVAPDDLLLLNMPGEYTSGTTRGLARELAGSIGCLFAEAPIADSIDLTVRQIDGLEASSADGSCRRTLRLSNFMLENVQARDRSSRVLAAAAAAFDGVFTCNANKSEATVGYTTLYGDLCGYLANIADLWKTEIYELAEYLNDQVFARQVVPEGSLKIVPSAELSDAQRVEDNKGDPLVYPYHDKLFCSWVERWDRVGPEEILEWYAAGRLEDELGFDGSVADHFAAPADFVEDLERWWNQYQGMGLVKRIQAPPVLAVKKRAYGFDHREAQIGPVYTRRYVELKKQLLAGASEESP